MFDREKNDPKGRECSEFCFYVKSRGTDPRRKVNRSVESRGCAEGNESYRQFSLAMISAVNQQPVIVVIIFNARDQNSCEKHVFQALVKNISLY